MKLALLFLAGLALNASAATVTVTAYCPCAVCCGVTGGTGLTASGKAARQGVTVAASRKVPMGARVHIDGIGWRVVQDRLAARFDGRVDVFFNTHAAAQKFGKRKLKVTVLP